jgi:hypothetical protein
MKTRHQCGLFSLWRQDDSACLQVYWPEIKVRWFDLCIVARTSFRLRLSRREIGAGFSVLGFGIGVAWWAKD